MPNQSTGVRAARTNPLVCNIQELITELEPPFYFSRSSQPAPRG